MIGAVAAGGRSRRTAVTLLVTPALTLAALPFLASLLLLVGYSFQLRPGGFADAPILAAWQRFLGDPFMWSVVWTSCRLAAQVAVITLVLAYPAAFILTRLRNPLLLAFCFVVIMSPHFVSVVVRSYGWMLLLSDNGLVNSLVRGMGLTPLRMTYNEFAVTVGLTHVLLPFAVLPIFSVLSQLPDTYVHSARDLGATPLQAFLKVTLPLSMPGVVVAGQIVFALTVGSFVTVSVLGGGRVMVLPEAIYQNIGNLEWALAAAQAITLLAISLIIIGLTAPFGRSGRLDVRS